VYGRKVTSFDVTSDGLILVGRQDETRLRICEKSRVSWMTLPALSVSLNLPTRVGELLDGMSDVRISCSLNPCPSPPQLGDHLENKGPSTWRWLAYCKFYHCSRLSLAFRETHLATKRRQLAAFSPSKFSTQTSGDPDDSSVSEDITLMVLRLTSPFSTREHCRGRERARLVLWSSTL